MPINLQSLSAMQNNAKVFLNNDGTFQKASVFSKRAAIDQNKQNIVDNLKQMIAADPKYFGVQKHLEGMIDGLMTSKLSAKGITAGQIKDILAYADSISTPKERKNAFISQAISTAFTLHKTNDNAEPTLMPKELANASHAMKDAYNAELYKNLNTISNTTENLKNINIENVVKQFDEKAVLVNDTAKTLDMPDKLADTFFAKGLEKNYSRQQLETLGGYYKEINDNPQLNNTHKNLLFDIALGDNEPLVREKFDTAVLAKENDFVYQEVKNSEEYNTHVENDLSAMGFAHDDVSFIKDQITKSIYNEVHKLVFNDTKATSDMLHDMTNDRLSKYQNIQEEIKSYANGDANLQKIGMRTVADLGEIPKAGYLKELHEASKAVNPAFIKEICHSKGLDRFDTAVNKLAKAILDSTDTMDKNVLPNELGPMKLNLTVHLLGECLNTLSVAERKNLYDRLSSPEVTNLFSMYNNDYKNGDSVFTAHTLNFMRDQIADMDNLDRTPFADKECNYAALPLSLQNRFSLDSVITGDLPKNLLKDIDVPRYQERFDSVTQSMLQINFLSEMKKMSGPENAVTVFEKDIKRGLQVTLSNGVTLENNFETAKNQLAFYVSHGRVNTFAELKPAENRTAQILMVCLSQETEKIVNMGAPMAFNGERNEQAFLTMENREANAGLKGGGRTFNVLDDGAGGFEIQYNCTRAINYFQENRAGARPMTLGPGSEEHYELNIHITGDEIKRLQTIDFSKMAELPKNVSNDDLVDWHTHFNFGDYNIQNVSITGGFSLNGVAEQQ